MCVVHVIFSLFKMNIIINNNNCKVKIQSEKYSFDLFVVCWLVRCFCWLRVRRVSHLTPHRSSTSHCSYFSIVIVIVLSFAVYLLTNSEQTNNGVNSIDTIRRKWTDRKWVWALPWNIKCARKIFAASSNWKKKRLLGQMFFSRIGWLVPAASTLCRAADIRLHNIVPWPNTNTKFTHLRLNAFNRFTQ